MILNNYENACRARDIIKRHAFPENHPLLQVGKGGSGSANAGGMISAVGSN